MQGKYAVIFASTKHNKDEEYLERDNELMALAETQPGYLGYESLANDNKSIFISYWENREAVDAWRDNMKHLAAKKDVAKWYSRYLSQICVIESSHEWVKD
jgi:heme-degrading monooxygenase HmoA